MSQPTQPSPDRDQQPPQVLEGTVVPEGQHARPSHGDSAGASPHPVVPPRGTHAEGYLPPQRTAPVAILAAILAVVGLLLGWLPFVGLVSAVAGLTLGIYSRVRKKAGPVLTTATMIIAALGVIAGLLSTGLIWWAVNEVSRNALLLMG